MKKHLSILILIVAAFCSLIKSAEAVPSLQLYLPDADYYEVSPWFPASGDSWITTSNPFDLQVAGATTPNWVNYIGNVELHIALLEDEYLLYQGLTTSFLTIKDNDPDIDFEKVLYATDFSFGKPSGVSTHGVYDSYFASVNLPNLLMGSAGETVYDYNKDFDPLNPDASGKDSGDIQHYTISYDPRFAFIHFDATGTVYNEAGKTKDVFAPYSHDADVAPIPEPTSLLLLGSGLFALKMFSRGKGKAKKA